MDDIEVIIRAQVAELKAGMESAAESVRASVMSMGESLEELAATSAESASEIAESNSMLRGSFEALAGYLGIRAVVDAVSDSEKSFAILESQVRATGGAAGFTADQLHAYAMALEQTTTSSHSEIEDLEGRLLAFTNITGEQFTRAVQVILDFSTVTGRDASAAVRTLGVALNDPVEGMARLRQAGVDLSDAQKAQIQALTDAGDLMGAQNALLGALEQSYSGAAAAVRGTFGGALEGLKHQLEDDVEGGPGSFNGATEAINKLTETLKDPAVEAGIGAITAAVAGLINILARAAQGIGDLVIGFQRIEAASLSDAIEEHTKELEKLAAAGAQATQQYQDLYNLLHQEVNESLNSGVAGLGATGAAGGANAPSAAAGTRPAGQYNPSSPDAQTNTLNSDTTAILQANTALLAQDNQLLAQGTALTEQQKMELQSQFDIRAQAQQNAIAQAEQMKKAWTDALEPIDKAFDSTIDGVIRGTETWKQGMSKMFDSMLQEYIDMCVHMATQWVVKEMTQTDATIAGDTTRTASAVSSSTTTQSADVAAASTGILANAWKAAASVYASVADIPYVGWILAPAMALAAAAEVGSFVGRIASAAGGWADVPSDQMAMIHKNEMVLPAAIAAPMRRALANGGMGGGQSHTYNITAMDSRSMHEALRRDPSVISKTVRHAVKMGSM